MNKNSKVFSSIGCYTPKTLQAQNIYESKALYLYNKSMNLYSYFKGLKHYQYTVKIR